MTIPQAVRERAGLLPDTEVDFVLDGDAVRIIKATPGKRPTRGARAIRRLREGGGGIKMTTDQIMAITRDEH